MDRDSQLDAAFAALAHPTRRAILARLLDGEATVNALAEPFDMSLPAVSKHIRVLENAGLIERGRTAQFRPCRLNPDPLRAVADWTEPYRRIWEARFDKMDDVLHALKGTEMTDQPNWVKIERVFDAPIDLVWRMWTEPELFKSWYGPMGMSVPVAEMDVTLGGTRKICMAMETPERSMSMWFIGVYKEISAPSRLVYTESMCDEDGTLIPPQAMGMPEGAPDVTEVIVDLREEDGRTVMTMVHVGVPEGTAGEGGWNQAFDKLATALSDRA